ncbi:DUF4079 domain-containing protein [Phormidesmis priestleyi]
MDFKDAILLLHPVIVIVIVFPLMGLIANRGLQVRQRRMQLAAGDKSKVPPVVGQEHVQTGHWLTAAVVGATLIALANDIFGTVVSSQLWSKNPFQVTLIGLLFVATIASLALLYRAHQVRWRATFAILTGMGLVILGCQDGVYRKTDQWYSSHYYYGIVASLLMIFSLSIVQSIYKDRTQRWRMVHVVISSVVALLFIGQAITGTRALLEVPLSWQEPYIQKLYEQQCDTKPCTVQPTPQTP